MGNHRTSFGKHEGKTEYQHVYELSLPSNKLVYIFKLNREIKALRKKKTTVTSPHYATAREAAIALDMYLINKGQEPVNILKKK